MNVLLFVRDRILSGNFLLEVSRKNFLLAQLLRGCLSNVKAFNKAVIPVVNYNCLV